MTIAGRFVAWLHGLAGPSLLESYHADYQRAVREREARSRRARECRMFDLARRLSVVVALVILALALAGCGGKIITPQPPEATPQPACEEGQHHSCYHNPGSGWVYACPIYDAAGGVVGVQNEPSPATCPAKPEKRPEPPGPLCPLPGQGLDPRTWCGCWENSGRTDGTWRYTGDCPTAPPAAGCVLAGEPTEAVAGQANTLGSAVNAAMQALRPDCTPGGTCLLGDLPLQEWQAQVEAKLRELGYCAGQHTPSTDEIAVAETATAPWQGFHIAAGDDSTGPVPPGEPRRTVVWSPAGYRGAWRAPGGAQPPPSAGACPAPVPPKVGRFGLKRHLRVNDSTPKFYNKAAQRWDGTTVTGYCSSLGINELWCPARVEGNPDRFPCERVGVSGKDDGAPMWRSDGRVVPTDNIFQATCDGCSWIEVCAADGTNCTRCQVDPASGLCE